MLLPGPRLNQVCGGVRDSDRTIYPVVDAGHRAALLQSVGQRKWDEAVYSPDKRGAWLEDERATGEAAPGTTLYAPHEATIGEKA